MASVKSKLLSGIVAVDSKVEAHDLEQSSGSNFINDNGVFKTTIDKAFLTETKKGGVCCTILFRGENSIDMDIYPVSMKGGKKITTCKMGKETVSLPDYKLFKQMYAVTTGTVKPLEEIETTEETIKYKKFGKEVSVEGEVIDELSGKSLQIAVRLCEEYAYNDGAVDKTEIKTDKNGNPFYSKSLDSVFSNKGFSAEEVVGKAEEAKAIELKKTFLAGEKATKRVKLEVAEKSDDVATETTDDSDVIDF